MKLATHCLGVRTINSFLRHYKYNQIHGLLHDLLCDEGQLDMLIKDVYANHAIQLAVDFEYNRICSIVMHHFVDYSVHQFGNYLVQRCMDGPQLEKLVDVFIENAITLSVHPKRETVVRILRSLEHSLKQKNAYNKLTELQTHCHIAQGKLQVTLPPPPPPPDTMRYNLVDVPEL